MSGDDYDDVRRRHDALYAHFRDVHAALGEHDDKTLTAAGSVRRLVAEREMLRAALKACVSLIKRVPEAKEQLRGELVDADEALRGINA